LFKFFDGKNQLHFLTKDSMKTLATQISGIGAVLICLPVMLDINRGGAYNPATFFLWALLSVVCTITLWRAKKGGHILMMGYTISDFSIGLYASIKSSKPSFGPFEWFTAALVVICIVIYVWCESRKQLTPSVIINGLACIIAGVPLIVDSFREPHKFGYGIAGAYIALSGLGFYGESTFNGRFIPALSVVYWIVAVVGVTIARA